MGIVTPIGDSGALAEAVIEIARNRQRYVRPRAEIERLFSVPRTTDDYLALYASLLGAPSTARPAGVSA
jgi:hypothetical protein